jgi:hypothetical protein
MAMAGGARVEVLAFGEVNFETEKNLIHFFEGQIKAWCLGQDSLQSRT